MTDREHIATQARETAENLTLENPEMFATILRSMALAASSGTNRVWQDEWRRSDFASPYAWAVSLRWAPQQGKSDKWSAMYLVASVSGPTKTIDGKVIDAPPIGMWSGCSLCEKFETEEECIAWMTEQGIYEPVPNSTPGAQITGIDREIKCGHCTLTGLFNDGSTRRLFSFFIDELSFSDDELIGKTEDEAHQLRHDRDVAYLRS